MSNEYKDWLIDKVKEESTLIKKYPFLQARDVDGNLKKDQLVPVDIPNGWYTLFYQMCEDIKDLVPDDFYFIQVKEKYNKLICYSVNSTPEVNSIIAKYEHMASCVCTVCGKPATYRTSGYIASFCDDCIKVLVGPEYEKWDRILFKPYFTTSSFIDGTLCTKSVSFEEEWTRYLRSLE